MAIFASILAPYDPNFQDRELARFSDPAAPSPAHPFGSDNPGRDYLSRTIYGPRVSLIIGFLSTGLAIAVGSGRSRATPGAGSICSSCASTTCC